jgi:hypothetical protein
MMADLHNSNKPLAQGTLSGEKLVEERFFLLGFAAGKDVEINENMWFTALNASQIELLNKVLARKRYF